jgi:hypothetical protein
VGTILFKKYKFYMVVILFSKKSVQEDTGKFKLYEIETMRIVKHIEISHNLRMK